MVIKKKTLIIVCIFIAVIVIFGAIATVKYVQKSNQKKEEIVQQERINRAVDREYKQLVREYDNIVGIILDSQYSLSLRCEYVRKLNDFLGDKLYPICTQPWEINDCMDSLKYNRERDLQIIRCNALIKISFGN